MAVGGFCQVAPQTRVYLGYSYNERKEMISDDDKGSHAAFLYLVHKLGDGIFIEGDSLTIYGGVEGATNVVRPDESPIGHDFLACEVGANYKIPMKKGFLSRHFEASVGAALRVEQRWRETGNEFSDEGADSETVGIFKMFASLKFWGGRR
jgi:hypothetical protein